MEVNNPRDSLLIASKLYTLIPEDKNDFRNDLMHFIKDSFYRSPELRKGTSAWKELENIMHKYVINPDKDWKAEMIDVYVGKIDV
jgi:hypothetical protein